MAWWRKLVGTLSRTPADSTVDLHGAPVPVTQDPAALLKLSDDGACAFRFPFRAYGAVLLGRQNEFAQKFGERSPEAQAARSANLYCAACRQPVPDGWLIHLGMGSATARANGDIPSPCCGSADGLWVYNRPGFGSITEKDLQALRVSWRREAQQWWAKQGAAPAVCDACSRPVPQGQGYVFAAWLRCDACTNGVLGPEALAQLRRNPDFFGPGELQKARALQTQTR